MPTDPGLVTIIISALFGGVASSLLTQHFFEQRERRKILLNKYEETIESLNAVGNIIAEFSSIIDEVQRDIDEHGSLSDETESVLSEFNHKFTYNDSSKYLIEIDQIELIRYYDNFFNSIAERYYQKTDFLYQQISDIEVDVDKGDFSKIEICEHTMDECAKLGNESRGKLRHRITTTMMAPLWQRAWEDVKRFFNGSNHIL